MQRKRAYEAPEASDGLRVLVDRLWPRGLAKTEARIGVWAKETAPSPELRREWHAAPDAEWQAYADRYRAQLADQSAGALTDLVAVLREHAVVTLVYAARDPEHSHAVVLEAALREAFAYLGNVPGNDPKRSP